MNVNLDRARENEPLLSWTIRPNLPSDAEAISALIGAVAAEALWLVTETYVPTEPWESILHEPAKLSNHILLVAESQKQIIGWCRAFPVFGNKSRHVVDVGIGVAKDWRDRGLGSELMTEGIQWAKEYGYEKMTLSVFSTNLRAIHVFVKLGFLQTGIRYKQFRVNDEYIDEVLMEQFLMS